MHAQSERLQVQPRTSVMCPQLGQVLIRSNFATIFRWAFLMKFMVASSRLVARLASTARAGTGVRTGPTVVVS